jgi:hypothetical protein
MGVMDIAMQFLPDLAHGGQRIRTGRRARLKPPLNPIHINPFPRFGRRRKAVTHMANNPGRRGKQAPWVIRENEEKEDALEAYFLEHVLGLKEHHAARDEAFRQIEDEAQRRHPDPTPEDIATAEAKEAALPSRQKTATQLRRSFAPLAVHLRGGVKRSRKRFIQKGQRAWDRTNPVPLTWELQKALTAEFMKTYVGIDCS